MKMKVKQEEEIPEWLIKQILKDLREAMAKAYIEEFEKIHGEGAWLEKVITPFFGLDKVCENKA